MTWEMARDLVRIAILIFVLLSWVNANLDKWYRFWRELTMPRATVNIEDTKRIDLKTMPARDGEEGGYVILRRMSYGQVIQRRELATQMTVRSGGRARGGANGSGGGGFEGEMTMINERVSRYEFQKCIVDHNLEDERGRKLNFENPSDFTILDPRVGQEIDSHISEMNNFDEESSEGDEGGSSGGQGNS